MIHICNPKINPTLSYSEARLRTLLSYCSNRLRAKLDEREQLSRRYREEAQQFILDGNQCKFFLL